MSWKYCISNIIIFFSIFTGILSPQESLDLDCGRFQLDIGDEGDFEYLYPADFNEKDHVRTEGDISFMASNWTDANGVAHTRWFDEAQLTAA